MAVTRQSGVVFAKYVVCGTTAVAAQFAVLVGLVELLGVDSLLSSMIALTVAIIINYNMQYHWTFNAQGSHGVVFTRYLIVTLCTLAANGLIFGFLTNSLGLWYPAAQVVSTGLIVIVNFVINRHYTFAVSAEHSSRA